MNDLRMIKTPVMLMLILVTLLAAAGPVGSAVAQGTRVGPGGSRPDAPRQRSGPADPAELETFLDELIGQQMEAYHIPGAAVSVVKDGKLFFAKGYGYADLENRIAVDPEQTLFAIGSVGKLFTWTAVLQLVEQGKLDLNADVNTYLDFRIPDTYPQPVTLKHLMTHTSGFEHRTLDSLVSDPGEVAPARDWLIARMARVRPPGQYAGYSNYNAMLAGYIVERVSGRSYGQYIQEQILDPLGMEHSAAEWPVRADLRGQAFMGYTYDDGVFEAHPNYVAQPAVMPSGGHRASVTDMARFMIAHLQGGRYSDAGIGETRILSEVTTAQMHTTLYRPDPRLLGVAYGLFDFSDNGQRTLGHSGYAAYMNSLLLLLPDQNLGVFVTYNSMGGADLVNQHFGFQRAFFDHYYPAPAGSPTQPPADFAGRAGRFEGSYRETMSAYTSYEKASGLFGAAEIRDAGDGTLRFTAPWGEWRFVEVAPLYFRQVDGPFAIVFREDDQGRITHLFADFAPQFALEKLSWYETPGFNMALLVGFVLIFLSMFPVGAIRFVRDRRPGSGRKPAVRDARVAEWMLVAISVLGLSFTAGTFLWGFPVPLFGHSILLKIVLGLGVLAAGLTAGAVVYTALAWKNRYWGIVARAYYTLVTVAAVAFVWFLNYWNLLGWRF